jgi:hypothetical protein
MIENYLSEFVWNVFMRNPYVVAGLRSAGLRAFVAAGESAEHVETHVMTDR